MQFSFGPFMLDLATCELKRDGISVPLQPRVFGVLRYLIEHRDRVVSKQELIDALWSGQQLNAVAVPWTINRARKALGQAPGQSSIIETVRGHGYRFAAQVTAPSAAPEKRGAREERGAREQSIQKPMVADPFVGRELVMQQLLSALDLASQGHGSLFLLTGEAGIGKTRVAAELAVLARRRGLGVWQGRCFENGIAPAFWPFVQVLRAARSDGTLRDASRKEGERLSAALEPRPGEELEPGKDTPTRADTRFWLLDRLSRWLCSTAERQARVIVLEDVHCADENSLLALALLAPLLAQTHLLVVATARDTSPMAEQRSVQGLTTRLRPCEHIALTGLRDVDVEAYLRALMSERVAKQLGRPLRSRTAGNPLFVREVARGLRAGWDEHSELQVEDVHVPQAVKEVIAVRLQGLEPQARLVLDAACVVGEELTPQLLQRALGLSAEAVLTGLQAGTRDHLIELKPDGAKYAFIHPLVREVMYSALSAARRAELHALIGLAFEHLGVVAPPLEALAYHFHLASLDVYYDRAVRYGRRAGDAAMQVLAYDEAAQFYAWALEAQPHVPAQDPYALSELLLLSAAALSLSGRRVEARTQCARVIELGSEAQLPEMLVRAACLVRPSIWFAHLPDGMALHALETALALAPESPETYGLRARAHALLACMPPYSLQIQDSGDLSREAVRLAENANDVSVLLDALRSRLIELSGPDTLAETLALTDQMLLHDPLPASSWSSDAHVARYTALMQRGDSKGAERALTAFGHTAAKLRVRLLSWHCERMRAQNLLERGQLDEAERQFSLLYEEAKRLRLPMRDTFHLAQCYALQFERTGKRVLRDETAAIEARPIPASSQRSPSVRAHAVLAALDRGELELAKSEFSALSAQEFAVVRNAPNALYVFTQLALAAGPLRDRAAAGFIRQQLQRHRGLIAVSPVLISVGCVARYLGVLDFGLGRYAQARECFTQAIEINARAGHELERLRASLGLAEVLVSSENRRDRAQANELAAQVASAARRCGAGGIFAAADQLLARPQSSKRAPA